MYGMSRFSATLPAGFKFHPTDQELVIHYLKQKVLPSPKPQISIIADVNIYKFDPWELPGKANFGEDEWFFFSPRDKKYPKGTRPNRAAASGYWKATGSDKPIITSVGSQCLGMKKSLVFYEGRPPKGLKTDWMMVEYRLLDDDFLSQRPKGSMRLDDWVLCRVRQKSKVAQQIGTGRNSDSSCSCSPPLFREYLHCQDQMRMEDYNISQQGNNNFSQLAQNYQTMATLGSEEHNENGQMMDFQENSPDKNYQTMATLGSEEHNENGQMMDFQENSPDNYYYPSFSTPTSNSESTINSKESFGEMLKTIERVLSVGGLDELLVSSEPNQQNLIQTAVASTPSNSSNASIFQISSPAMQHFSSDF